MRQAWMVGCLLMLAACGLTPVYGTRDGSVPFDQMTIAPIPDRTGQALRNALMDRFYQSDVPRSPRYQLVIAPLVETVRDMDITADDEATRRSLRLSTQMQVIKVGEDQPVFARDLYALVSYNVLQSQFTTRVAEQNARDHAVNDLARQVEQILSTADLGL